MINQKVSKQVRIDSWLLKLLSSENKNKKQRSTKNNQKITEK